MRLRNEVVDDIVEQWRRRQAWHRAEKSLTLQAKALCRRLVHGDKKEADKLFAAINGKGEHPKTEIGTAAVFPLLAGRAAVEESRKAVEKSLVRAAKELPVAEWVGHQRGLGLLLVAGIVGEAGDLGGYATHSKLWKRMGVAVIDGKRQRKVAGEAALVHGYAPRRRSLVWVLGGCLMKAVGEFKAVYDIRKAHELERGFPKAHAHNRAKRYMEKRALRELWRAWRQADVRVTARPRTQMSIPPEGQRTAAALARANLTMLSGGTQEWSAVSDWNTADNSVKVIPMRAGHLDHGHQEV